MKKVGFHKFLHEKFKFKETSRSKEHPSIKEFRNEMHMACESSKEIKDALKNAVGNTIDAIKAKHIFSNIPKEDYPLLCMSIEATNPSNLILTSVPVSPSVIRPSVVSDIRSGTNEDDLTTSLMQIIKLNNSIEQGFMAGKDISGHQGQVSSYF